MTTYYACYIINNRKRVLLMAPMKRAVSILITTFVLISGFAGCAKDANTDETTILTAYTIDAAETAADSAEAAAVSAEAAAVSAEAAAVSAEAAAVSAEAAGITGTTIFEAATVAGATTDKTVATNPQATQTPAIKAGDTIYFGNYEQDNNTANGKEKIACKVLDVKIGKALLISEKVLDARPYNIEKKDITWETCTLRKWLNEDFYNTAFSSSEQIKIDTTNVINNDNPVCGTSGGNLTVDKIFLLSYEEADRYFTDYEKCTSKGTDFAKNNRLYVSDIEQYLGNSDWWLRSPGISQDSAGVVLMDGNYQGSRTVSKITFGVRPAFWINL